ncbi:hypothetical protein G647_02240 [Cladophialophora carrionii CBS 160.54]|uniref:protein-tyrosine-phosphatase n=1 Tax=Cladophialophora carrionii CBS 160.54 TaxID=1279043 RepID=V9DHP7_9EURO|nr:uncharacterized protein G647_02240 [Cladophialophora carrionii CBS 160.54]ETI25467.1 hypothetical protein G647_02240 [Cladophialophora carrionii CBS 160.54]
MSRSLNPGFADADVDVDADAGAAAAAKAESDAHADTQRDGRIVRRGVEVKVLDLDDDPLADILEWLDETCDWIQEGLDASIDGKNKNLDISIYEPRPSEATNRPDRPGVLVHCKQGVSRSGAFVVAFLMRRFQLSYASALSLARESRSQITPNSGFEKQLRVWEFCGYNVYECGEEAGGSGEAGSGEAVRKEKRPYRAWKAERDNLLKRGEEDVNRARFSSLADMAARFGRRRQDVMAAEGEEETSPMNSTREDDGKLDKVLGQDKRREAWERVQKMEREWNERLIRGQSQGQGQVIGDHDEETQK